MCESQYRGSLGPLKISDPDQSHPLCDAFIDAVANATGAPKHNDYNAESQRGTGYYQRFISEGSRQTTAREFLRPAVRQGKVDLRTNAPVTKLVIESGKVTGVEITRSADGAAETISANRQVLLCAGTINSSRLLQCSGVGDAQWLREAGVSVEHHLPGVGKNLQDHYFVRLAARVSADIITLNQQARGFRLAREIYRWCMKKPSILAWTPSIAYAFLNSDGTDATPDLQFVFSHGSYRPGKVYELDRYQSEEVPGADVNTDAEILDYARQTGNTGYHLVGSCMMGPDSNPMAVVDPSLNVHGLSGLRVIDASVMPSVTSSNTCAASIMIGEKGADLILNEH